MDNFKEVLKNKVSRRKFVTGVTAGVGVTAATAFAAGCSGGTTNTTPAPTPTPAPPTTTAFTDVDILNFALNLEYLEAEFYLRATTGAGLSAADIGTSPGAVTGGTQVTFVTPEVQQYAVEVASHELLHVRALRAAITSLGSTPVDRPAINFTDAFNAAAVAASIGPSFNAFADENSFLLGAFTFEDVGVTAYNGAAALITNKTVVLAAAGGIVAIEAYHAGLIRYLINNLPPAMVTIANQISTLRGLASVASGGSSGAAETPISNSTIVAANPGTSLGFVRDTNQILHILYLNATAGPVSRGGFFPAGLNGRITASLS